MICLEIEHSNSTLYTELRSSLNLKWSEPLALSSRGGRERQLEPGLVNSVSRVTGRMEKVADRAKRRC